MKIAQIAPLYESVPPKYYGGTERVVSYLTEELVRQGHDVTLFASGDSLTKAKLVSCCPESLRLNSSCIDQMAHHLWMIERVFQRAKDFEIIHSHMDYLPFSVARRHQEIPFVTTMHGRLDIPDIYGLHEEFCEMPLVSISFAQRKPLAHSNWVANIYHGLPEDSFSFQEKPGKYLAFLGRISPEKRVDLAIAIAKGFGMPLKIAAKIDHQDKKYFETEIKHLLDHPLVDYIGEINEDQKSGFLGNAYALLSPVDWPEPFGLVIIEAMACGTPVITRPYGSIPEIMVQGQTGYVVDTVEESIDALKKLEKFDRCQCRRIFEQRFTARSMAQNYAALYNHLITNPKRSRVKEPELAS